MTSSRSCPSAYWPRYFLTQRYSSFFIHRFAVACEIVFLSCHLDRTSGSFRYSIMSCDLTYLLLDCRCRLISCLNSSSSSIFETFQLPYGLCGMVWDVTNFLVASRRLQDLWSVGFPTACAASFDASIHFPFTLELVPVNKFKKVCNSLRTCLDHPLRVDSLYRFCFPWYLGRSKPSISVSASRAWRSVGGFLCSQDVPTPGSGWWRKAGPPWESSLFSNSELDWVCTASGKASFDASISDGPV